MDVRSLLERERWDKECGRVKEQSRLLTSRVDVELKRAAVAVWRNQIVGRWHRVLNGWYLSISTAQVALPHGDH